jgi:hypothetical protein
VPVNPGENVGNGSSSAGRRMFFGETPLLGTIVGHQRPLPPEMVGCANCHWEDPGSISTRSFAPRLDRAGMIAPRGRRGGPPSRFSAVSFCRLLRTGVDPMLQASVIICAHNEVGLFRVLASLRSQTFPLISGNF